MRINIVQIGDSRGIRIPKAILDRCGIEQEVGLDVRGGSIILEPVGRTPRFGWDEAFHRMAERHDDQLLIDESQYRHCYCGSHDDEILELSDTCGRPVQWERRLGCAGPNPNDR